MKKELLLLALKQDRPQFVHTFLKLDFNLPSIFYRHQSNREWTLNQTQLIDLYNDEEIRNVRRRKKRINSKEFCFCRAKIFIFLNKLSEKNVSIQLKISIEF